MMLQWFRKRKLKMPNAICDNSKEKQGSYIEGIPVISFEDALEKFSALEILITSTKFGNEIEENLIGKISQDKIINIQKYFLSINIPENKVVEENIKRYIASLRGENQDKFTLLNPQDMPDDVKSAMLKCKEFKEIFERGEELKIPIDDYFVRFHNNDFWRTLFEMEKTINTESTLSLKDIFESDHFNDMKKVGNHLIYQELSPIADIHSSVVERIDGFYQYLSKKDIPFMYVQLPNKLSNIKPEFQKQVVDKVNPAATYIVNDLKSRGIPCLDYREVMKQEKLDSFEYFYKTDLHWNSILAFKAGQNILKEIAHSCGFVLDQSKCEIENYERLCYKQIFLGSYGRNTGLLFSGIDDFEVILPKFETMYSRSNVHKGFFVKGNTREALLSSVYLGGIILHIPLMVPTL